MITKPKGSAMCSFQESLRTSTASGHLSLGLLDAAIQEAEDDSLLHNLEFLLAKVREFRAWSTDVRHQAQLDIRQDIILESRDVILQSGRHN